MKAASRKVRELTLVGHALASTRHPVMAQIVPMRRCNLACAYCNEYDDVSKPVPVEEMLRRIDHLARLGTSIITISGGEPLLQSQFVAKILRRCRKLGLHTALDTSGYLGVRVSDAMLADLDLVLLDVKSGLAETYREVTGRELAPTLKFGRRVAESGTPIWARFVLVPDLTDAPANVDAVADYVASLSSVERVEVLTGGATTTTSTTAAGSTTSKTSVTSTTLTTKTSTTTTTSQVTTTTSTTTTASGSGGSTQTLYGQCGGAGWTGATACNSQATCSSQNPYYSQCLPTGA